MVRTMVANGSTMTNEGSGSAVLQDKHGTVLDLSGSTVLYNPSAPCNLIAKAAWQKAGCFFTESTAGDTLTTASGDVFEVVQHGGLPCVKMRAAAVTGLPEQAYAHLAVYDTALAHRRLGHADTNIINGDGAFCCDDPLVMEPSPTERSRLTSSLAVLPSSPAPTTLLR